MIYLTFCGSVTYLNKDITKQRATLFGAWPFALDYKFAIYLRQRKGNGNLPAEQMFL